MILCKMLEPWNSAKILENRIAQQDNCPKRKDRGAGSISADLFFNSYKFKISRSTRDDSKNGLFTKPSNFKLQINHNKKIATPNK